ncbi:MAG: DNA methyltransferase, partial [Campylobacterota bacterium]|nr:DNA methyltransferase [Campylobacterota bacterium]
MSLALLKEEYSQEKFESFIKETFKIEEIDTRFKSDGLNQNHLEHIDAYKFIGRTRLSDKSRLGFFVFKSKNKNIEKKRVGFNAIIPSLTQKHIITHALVAIFHPESKVWRLSYVAFDTKDGKQTLNTSIKRYTYELGAGIPIKTAQNQLQLIVDSDKISKKILEEVFSVEKLNDRFFADYKRLFEKLNAYLSENNFANFERDNANIRGFSKKLLGRITFLYFLQKKGWLGAKKSWGDGDRRFLSKCFEGKYKKYDNFYDDILKDIFFKALNDDRRESDNLFKEFGKMPYLNGGLFSADGMDNDERLHIENTIFENIINTFDQYNFTIIEDTPHESEVAIDPEMLGKVFENLLEENYKSGKGAFYTPREIVHYMCKESIYEYLLPDALNKEAVRKLVFEGELDPTIERQKIKEKIEAIKILDPAIGSGAFPMGLLGELIHILQLLDENLDVVQAKIDIIQNSIYGIDIDPSAVEIAQLRFWLSIVVDEKKPRALPNLDFKIMIGNSLLETIHGNDPLKNRRGLDDKLNDLNQLFNSFYDPDADKNQLREKISQILQGIFKPLSKRYSTQAPLNTDAKKHKKDLDNAFKAKDIDNILKALSHKGFSNQIFLYKLFFKDILKSGGFNIIIGNPPYLRVQGIDKEVSKQYKNHF